MKIKVSDYIASFIASIGVKEVFLIPGGVNTNLVDSIARNEELSYVCNHHEQACAISAESYSRINNNIGVCVVTVGPGVTNTITGIAGAWLDSIPTLYISGQVKRGDMIINSGSKVRQLGVQELDPIKLVQSITKYAEVVMDPNDIKYHLQKAVYVAKNGRPGPVYLDIPSDVLGSFVEEGELRSFDEVLKKDDFLISGGLSKDIGDLIDLLKQSKRPVIFAGHGIRLSQGQEIFLELVNKLNIPVLTTMSAHDLIPTKHSLYIGRPGVFGDRAGNFAIQNCDLLISIGARHHLWNIGYNYEEFARNAKKIVIDIDEEELNKKTVIPNVPICVDAKKFMYAMLQIVDFSLLPDISEWIKVCQGWKQKYPVVLPEYANEKEYVNSYYFTDVLSSLLVEKDVIVTGVGTSFTGTLQCFKTKKDQRLISNVGCAAMGYDLPASIGACFANKKKRVILITGDGSIMMNLQELQTIVHYKLPIKIFLINNKGYLAIKNTQNNFFDGRLNAVDEKSGVTFPDFKKIAMAFGIEYEKIENHNNMENIIKNVLQSSGSIICEINMSPNQPLLPKVYSQKNSDGSMESKPLEDMYPFLDRDEFLSNMTNK